MSFTSLFSISSYFFNFLLLLLFFSFSFLFMFSFNFILLLLFGFLIRFSLGLLLLFCLSFLLLLLIILDFLITRPIIRFSLGLSSLLLNLLFSRHLLVQPLSVGCGCFLGGMFLVKINWLLEIFVFWLLCWFFRIIFIILFRLLQWLGFRLRFSHCFRFNGCLDLFWLD